MPFEMKAVRAMPDGFEIEFTRPADKSTAENVENYQVTSYTYKYHPVYGSPIVKVGGNPVLGAKASADGLRVRLVVDSLRLGFVHDIRPEGVRSDKDALPLLHGMAYYTLNALPKGPKADFALAPVRPKTIDISQVTDAGSKVNTPDNQMKEARPTTKGQEMAAAKEKAAVKTTAKPAAPAKAPIDKTAVAALLQKHTCTACHKERERAVGPPYAEIAKRKYSISKIVELVYTPQPQNWPDYSTPMAPMAHVPKKDIEKIAAWINTIK